MGKQVKYRVNNQIKVSLVMVICDDENLGVMPTTKAKGIAFKKGLDLVEVAPGASPPVCRIIDYGKFKYDKGVKERRQKQQQSKKHFKEVRMRPSIGEHDAETKIKAISKFLKAGDRVQIKIQFKKRENAHRDLGFKLIKRIISEVSDIGEVKTPPKLDGKSIICVLEAATD